MDNQTLPPNKNTLEFLLKAANFLEENPKKSWNGLSYNDIRNILSILATSLEIDIDPKTATLKELIDAFSKELTEEGKKKLQQSIPSNLKELVEEYEKSIEGVEEKEIPPVLKEKAAEKVKAFIELKEKQIKVEKLAEKFASGILPTLTQNPVFPNASLETIAAVVQIVSETFIPEENLIIETKKTTDKERISRAWGQNWQNTVDEKVLPRLREEYGIVLSSEQEADFKAFTPLVEQIIQIASGQKTITSAAENLPVIRDLPLSQETRKVVTEIIRDEISGNEGLEDTIRQLDILPPQNRKDIEARLEETWNTSWKQIIDEKVLPRLEIEGILPTPEQSDALRNFSPPAKDIPQQVNDLKAPVVEKAPIREWIEGQITPINRTQAEEVLKIVAPVVITNLPQTDLTEEKLSKLSPVERERVIEDLKVKIENSIYISLAQSSEEIVNRGITLSPIETQKFINGLVPVNSEQVTNLLPILSVPSSERAMLLEKGTNIKIATTVAGIASVSNDNPPLFASSLKLATFTRLSEVKDENGKPVARQLNQVLVTQGINKNTVAFLRAPIVKYQSIVLSLKGITPGDLEFTKENLIKRGLKLDSPEIKELDIIKQNLASFQQTTRLPFAHWQKQAEKKFTPFRVPNSNFATIIEKPTVKTTGKRGFLADKITFIGQSQATVITKFTAYKQRFFDGAKKWFYNTGLGNSIKLGLEKAGAKSLQTLWAATKSGAQKAISKGISSFFVKIGVGAMGAATGGLSIVASAAFSFIGKKIVPLIKNGFKALMGGFGLANSFLGGLTGGDFSKEDDENLKFAGGGALVVMIVFPILAIIILIVSFFDFPQRPADFVPGVQGQLQCISDARHYSEEVLCRLYSDECNLKKLGIVTISQGPQWDNAKSCLLSSNLTGNITELVRIFEGSVKGSGNEGNLQCVGFAMGIEAALGRDLPGRNAYAYLLPLKNDNLLTNYNLYDKDHSLPLDPTDPENTKKGLKVGDLLVWGGSPGHIVVFLGIKGNVNISTAEANGNNGRVGVIDNRVFTNFAGDGGPDGVLRPK